MQVHNKLLTRKEVADYFDITFPTLKRLIDDGIIPAYRLGKKKLYFKEAEIMNTTLRAVPKKEAVHG
jgi:excisionase family DNA binding protein